VIAGWDLTTMGQSLWFCGGAFIIFIFSFTDSNHSTEKSWDYSCGSCLQTQGWIALHLSVW